MKALMYIGIPVIAILILVKILTDLLPQTIVLMSVVTWLILLGIMAGGFLYIAKELEGPKG